MIGHREGRKDETLPDPLSWEDKAFTKQRAETWLARPSRWDVQPPNWGAARNPRPLGDPPR